MTDSRRISWILIFCLIVGASLMLAKWKMGASPPDQHTQALPVRNPRGRLVKDEGQSVQPRVRRERDVAGNATKPLQPKGEGTPTEEVAHADEDQIYTMAALPQGKPGIYQVLVDGEVVEIAVDFPGEGSPVGIEDLDRTDQ